MTAQEDLYYPVSLVPPDISSYRVGNTGVKYIHQLDSGVPGPHVMISSVVHGNELCGAIAVDHMLQNNVRPLKGKLSEEIIPLASGRPMLNGRATAYVCQNQACRLPVHTVEELRELLD